MPNKKLLYWMWIKGNLINSIVNWTMAVLHDEVLHSSFLKLQHTMSILHYKCILDHPHSLLKFLQLHYNSTMLYRMCFFQLRVWYQKINMLIESIKNSVILFFLKNFYNMVFAFTHNAINCFFFLLIIYNELNK